MKTLVAILALFMSIGLTTTHARAQDNYIGEIILGGWNFCPRGTAKADGQLLAINSNQALFALYGTNYGGDGRTTFGLPDLRGRAPIHNGAGPGLSSIQLGQKGGVEQVTLNTNTLPSHSHNATTTTNAAAASANTPSPAGNLLGITSTTPIYAGAGGPTLPMSSDMVETSIGSTGGSQPIFTRSPFQAIMYCIVMQGIFPSRN